MDAYFYLILGIAATAGIGFSAITRGILYATPDTDNELMAYAAAQSHKWRWPSDIHKYGVGKTRMKDVSILLLAIFQKITGDKESDYPYIILTGFTVSISSILIYFIGYNYWGETIGLFVSLIYLFSFWPWQISLYGGHINIATTFVLASILFIQNLVPGQGINLYLAIAGALFCCAMFSSASTSKYTIVFWAAVFYSQYHSLILELDYFKLYSALPLNNLWKTNIIVIIGLNLIITLAFLFYKKIVKVMYKGGGPSYFNGIIENKNNLPLEHYLAHARKRLKLFAKLLTVSVIAILILLNLIGLNYVISVALGFGAMLMFLTLPDIKKNIYSYIRYFIEPSFKSHFKPLIEVFAKKGITVYGNTRGAGWSWVPKIFWRLAQLHVIIFLASFVSLLMLRINNDRIYLLLTDLMILIISTSPIWWAEFTKAPQISRSYSPTLATSLLFIGYSFYIFSVYNIATPIMIGFLILLLAWSLRIFLSDVYPARMGATNMFKLLKRLKIKEVYTYNTKYNKSMVEAIPGLGESEYTPRRKIEPPLIVHHIKSIADVKNGWIVIPGTNGKSITMHMDPEAMNGDFRFTADPILNKLVESGDIEKISVAKLKTYGTSRIWSLEDESLGYIDLILNEISPEDIYRGYAWLVHSSKLEVNDYH